MIDTHAHIVSEYYNNIDELILNLKDKKITNVINCGTGIKDSKEIIELSKKYNNFLLPAIGIHPENIDEINNLNELEELIKNNEILAIGEIGLDYHYSKENKELQKELFIKQLDLAEKFNLPIIVHIRESINDTFNILKERKLKGIIHCYSGSYEMAKEFIKLGYYLGIGGVLTFKNSKLYEVIEKIGIDHLVLETDSPYLAPHPLRGTQNNPANTYYVLDKLSEITKINKEEILEVINRNVHTIFDI